MRVVRIDQLAPGGAALEVHPRLTVLRGASPELRRRLAATVAAIAGRGELDLTGVIEVSGVQLALDAATVAQLRIEPGIDPVIVGLGARRPGAQRGGDQRTAPIPAVDLPTPVVVVSSAEADLRAELRTVTTARTALGAEMEAARAGLDSFSTAALEVCLGQIDALETRRSALRVDWERVRDERDRELAEATAQLAAVRALVERLAGVDPSEVRVRRDGLLSLQEHSGEPDRAAAQLAAQLDAAAARVREMAERREQFRRREADALAELDEARSQVEAAERAAVAPTVDRSVVQRLEAVRDEIFEVDDRQSVLAAARNKRRLAELRSEEAILLDRLGFDTYSSYVMGIPSVRAELERAAQVDAALEHVQQLESQLVAMRADAPSEADLADAAFQLHRLLGQAARLLGAADVAVDAEALAADVIEGGDGARVVHDIGVELRDRRIVSPEFTDEAAAALGVALDELSAAVAGIDVVLPVAPDSVPQPPTAPGPVDPMAAPAVLLARSEEWLDWFEELRRWLASVDAGTETLERRVAELGSRPRDERMERWAEVEAELDEALDRLTEAQERVRAHEEATARLATLRDRELELRDRERELLERIAAETATTRPPPPPPPVTEVRPDAVDAADGASTEGPLAADQHDPGAVEWAVVARLARQRSVSFVGSLPLVVDGLPDDPSVRAAVLGRLDRMSDLVQVVVVSDDDSAAVWAAGLGERGRCVEL